MKKLAHYENLPDSMSEGELFVEFICVIECYESCKCDRAFFLKALLELADRQWHTYAVLREDLKVRIESILMGLWDDNNLAVAEDLLVLCGRLGLQGLYVFCCAQKEKSNLPDIIEEIDSAILEFGDSVADPYVGMK